MKLFTKEIDKKLFNEYNKYAADPSLESQIAIAKIFNPYGRGNWYILNSDPEDPDYLWAIVDLFEVEIGSVSRSELETLKVPPFGLGLERDLYFTPVNAKELYEGLLAGKTYEKGGTVSTDENKEMLSNLAVQLNHHSKELMSLLPNAKDVEPWVIAKAQRSATDLSDITHYLEGNEKMAYEDGGIMADSSQVGKENIHLKSYNILGEEINSGSIIFDYSNDTIQLPFGKTFKVENDSNCTFKVLKTRIKAKGGIKGLADFIKEINTKSSPFNPSLTNQFIKGFDRYEDGGMMADGGEIKNKIDELYIKSNFISNHFNWESKLLEMLQDRSIEAYNIYQSLSKIQKGEVLQELFEIDNDMGSDGDGNIETSIENLTILLEDAKMGKYYNNGGMMDDGGETDNYAIAKSKAFDSIDWEEELKEEVGDYYDSLTKREREQIISDIQKDWSRSTFFEKGGEFGVDKHRIYFSYFSEVMEAIHDIANENGYNVVGIFPDLSYGGVGYGQTKRANVELEWNGKEKVGKSKKRDKNTLNVQIYRMDSGKYELNSYFSYEDGGVMAKGGYMAAGGETGDYEQFEMIVFFKELEKDGGKVFKDRFLVSAKNVGEAKDIAIRLWKDEYSDESDLSIVDVLTDAEYRMKGKSKHEDGGMMAKGGVTFQDKVNAISSRLVNKKVPSKYKKDYGAKYDKQEAILAAKKIAGSMVKKMR